MEKAWRRKFVAECNYTIEIGRKHQEGQEHIGHS
jgi:hypothetical protein